ncbi:MAG TPA: glycoside hydrolase domain-containing protein, partial [Phycisphaerae bacterium]|nr:glycoside hydrolase domain-containing protein [Phycisphaerae bacterium]
MRRSGFATGLLLVALLWAAAGGCSDVGRAKEVALDLPFDGGVGKMASAATDEGEAAKPKFAEGKFDRALVVDGEGLQCGLSGALDPVRGSMECWIFADAKEETDRPILSWKIEGGSETTISLVGSGDDLQVEWGSFLFPDVPRVTTIYSAYSQANGGPGKKKKDSPPAETGPAPAPPKWHHVVVTWSSAITKIYFDGKSYFFLPQASRQMVNEGKGTLLVGKGGKGAPFRLDNLRVYSFPLTAEQVTRQFERANGGREAMGEQNRFPLVAEWGPSLKKAVVYVDRKFASGRDRSVAAVVSLHKVGQDGALDVTRLTHFPQDLAEALIELPHLGKGKWFLQADLADAKGKILATARTPEYTFPEVPYLFNDLGISDEILEPYTPIEVERNALRVWGREITLNGLGLPDQMVSAGKELLSRPVELAGSIGGSRIQWKMPRPVEITEQSGRLTRWTGEAAGGGVKLHVDGSIEYDGLMRFDLTIAPQDQPVKLDNLVLELDVPSDRARYWTGFAGEWMHQYMGRLDPQKTGVLVTGKQLGQWVTRGFFVPYFQMMDFDRVLAWLAVNDKGWRHADGVQPMQVVRRTPGGPVTLQQHFFARKSTLTEPVTITFYLHSGPLHAPPKRWRAWVVGHHDSGPFGKRTPVKAWWVWSGDGWGRNKDAFQPYPEDMEMSRKRNAGQLARGVTVVPFCNIGWPGGWKENREFYPEMAKLPYWWHVANTRANQDFFLWNLHRWAVEGGMRGVYYDEPYCELASYNLFTGAYLKEDGTRQAGYHWPYQREMLRRSQHMFRKFQDVRGLVWLHKTSYNNLACLAFADIAMDGEWPYPDPKKPEIFADRFRVWDADRSVAFLMGHQYGLVPSTMANYSCRNDRERLTGVRSYMALTVPFDILMVGNPPPGEEFTRVRAAKAWLPVDAEDVKFFGWWDLDQNDAPVTDVSGTAWVSAYVRPQRMLIV